jgi:hypothetical protein
VSGAPDLATYRVTGDGSTGADPITVLTCDTCSHGYRGQGDVRWWEDGDSPSIADLIAEAQRHETAGHTRT